MLFKVPIAAGFLVLVVVAVLFSSVGSTQTVRAGGCTDTDVTQWAVADGGNGHWYQGLCGERTWDEAVADAETAQPEAHLATLTSAEENEFAFDLIDSDEFWFDGGGYCTGPWIGGVQPADAEEPDGEWGWVTGEPFGFESWDVGEPNEGAPNEDRILFYTSGCPSGDRSAYWNDLFSVYESTHLVEWDFLLVQGDLNCDGDIDEDDMMLLLGDLADVVDGGQSAPCLDLDEPEPVTGRGWGNVSCNDELDVIDALFILAYHAETDTPTPGGQCFAMGAPIVYPPD